MNPQVKKRNRVLGIDPGFDRLGIAVLEGDAGKPTYVWSECVDIPKGTREQRLAAVFKTVANAVEIHQPDRAVVEDLFFSTNKKTALSVAEARGAVFAALGASGLPVMQQTPMQIKVAVTGYGGADKKAVEHMVKKLVLLPEKKRRDDEFDALAVAICGMALLSTGG